MLDDSFHHSLENEVFYMSYIDISTCSTCTTEVTTEVSSESEVDESNLPDVVQELNINDFK